jgi:hypothetical protein
LIQLVGYLLSAAEDYPGLWIKSGTHRLAPTLPRYEASLPS